MTNQLFTLLRVSHLWLAALHICTEFQCTWRIVGGYKATRPYRRKQSLRRLPNFPVSQLWRCQKFKLSALQQNYRVKFTYLRNTRRWKYTPLTLIHSSDLLNTFRHMCWSCSLSCGALQYKGFLFSYPPMDFLSLSLVLKHSHWLKLRFTEVTTSYWIMWLQWMRNCFCKVDISVLLKLFSLSVLIFTFLLQGVQNICNTRFTTGGILTNVIKSLVTE
jgi:hypothetical protein